MIGEVASETAFLSAFRCKLIERFNTSSTQKCPVAKDLEHKSSYFEVISRVKALFSLSFRNTLQGERPEEK